MKQSKTYLRQLAANTETEPRRPDHKPLETPVTFSNDEFAMTKTGRVVGYFPDDDNTPVHVVETADGQRWVVLDYEMKS